MGGTAVLDDDVLVDSLVADVIDELRGELHADFGVRAYRCFFVRRTYTGRSIGEGKFTDVAVEMTPSPKVDVWTGRKYDLVACGLNESGDIRLTEVSLSYTYDEITGGALGANQQWFLRLDEAHGQGQPSTYWVPSKAPFVDRIETLGWIVWLRKLDIAGAT